MMEFSEFSERLMASRWIAGPDINDAISRSRRYNRKGMRTMINYLGEEFGDRHDVDDALNIYLKLIKRIKSDRVRADISVKPTQLGLKLGYNLFVQNYAKIVRFAKANGVFVWLDMEDKSTVDPTIRAYLEFVKSGNTGICIQAYLKRSAKDIARLVRHNAVIRLVKGAYAYSGSRAAISRNYLKLMGYLFKKSKRIMIATHDDKLTSTALKLNKRWKKEVTFAMLNGIREELAASLASSGGNVSIYVPFGSKWIDYAYRRLKEGGHLSLVLRSLLSRGA